MYDPEFYVGLCEVTNAVSEARMVSGLFTDVIPSADNEKFNFESSKNITMDRCTYSCIPIPGENNWVKNVKALQYKQLPTCVAASNMTIKRKVEEIEDIDENIAMDMDENIASSSKRIKNDEVKIELSSNHFEVNMPIPGENGFSFLVKVYDNLDIKLNDMLKVYGIFSIDTSSANLNNNDSDILDEMSLIEQKFHNPPPSLVPRLHAVYINKLQHNNPLLQSCKIKNITEDIEIEICSIREDFLIFLSQMMLGDRLAGELLLCHLLSSVYARRDFLPIGNFSLNLVNCPKNKGFVNKFYEILQNLVTNSQYIPLTIEILNSDLFSPKKNYAENRLKSGRLQLCTSTHLVIDETTMENGHLKVEGVKNLTALGNVAKWQKVVYDFEYHQQDFECDFPSIVMSEGKSLIQCECIVYLCYNENIDVENHLNETMNTLDPAKLERFRKYLSYMRIKDYELSENVKQFIEEDFVTMRKEDPQSLSVDTFHMLLVLSRLLSISYNKNGLDLDCWKRAKVLNNLRNQRMKDSTAPSL